MKNSPALAGLLNRDRERDVAGGENTGSGMSGGGGGNGNGTAGHAHVNATPANVGVGLGISANGVATGSNGNITAVIGKDDKMHIDTDPSALSKSTPGPETSTAPDSPLTETSSILSEPPEGDGDDEEKGGEGEGGEVLLKPGSGGGGSAVGRPRRAVRDVGGVGA